jgi:putative transposase
MITELLSRGAQVRALPGAPFPKEFAHRVARHHVQHRRRGNCYDDAAIESFFATVKKEDAERFPSYSDAKMVLFDYIEVFYNQRRRHSTLGQISPAAFERLAAA